MRSIEYNIPHKSTPIVYIDMDGCIADFFGAIAKAHDVEYWKEIHRQKLGIDQVAQKPGFFRNLKPMPNAAKLIAGVLKIANKYSILSSPLQSNVEQSSEEKSDWLKHHLKNHQPQAVIFDHEKFKFAKQADGTPNILIDDWDTNIKLWEANGGIGILYSDERYKDALKKLHHALYNNHDDHNFETDIAEDEEIDFDVTRNNGMYTAKQVLKYVTGIHHEYHMPKPILAHKIWLLKNIPISKLKTSEMIHQDDPYRRVIDIDWDHVANIQPENVKNKPIVVDDEFWVLDGNHRVAYCRANGIRKIPCLVPFVK